MSRNTIQQRRLQLQEELNILDEEDKKLQLQEKQLKTQHLDNIIFEYETMYKEAETIQIRLEEQRKYIQGYLCKNIEVNDSIYHKRVDNFIKRISGVMRKSLDGVYGCIWVYDFTFHGVKYHFEIYAGTKGLSDNEYKINPELLPIKEEQIAIDALGVKSVKPYLSTNEKSYW